MNILKAIVLLSIAGCLIPVVEAANQDRLTEAEELFKRRCANAGERIERTVNDVEGIVLLKVRPHMVRDANQFRLDDPYGRDLGGDGYIQSFLKAEYDLYENRKITRANTKPVAPQTRFGYHFVDVLGIDGKRNRYTAYLEQPGKTNSAFLLDYYRVVMSSSPTLAPSPRYGVTYDDISTPEDRKLWIAGSSLRVVDLSDNSVIAERIGYMMDRGQGYNNNGRIPWLLAAYNACPAFPGNPPPTGQQGQTIRFVEKVLIPKRD